MTSNGKGIGEGFFGSTGAYLLGVATLLACGIQIALGQPQHVWRNQLGMEFVLIPAGEFTMGSTTKLANADERPLRRVRISREFYLGKFEVTQGQWQAVMGMNPSIDQSCGADCPVENVSWHEAQSFVNRLNEQAGASLYRLPTEAEWEYAARAGTTGDRYADDLDAIARCGDAPAGPVGDREPNGFGLHDMLGNVWEWVQDWGAYYPIGGATDPAGPASGLYRVFRGGSHQADPLDCRSASRYYDDPNNYFRDVGVRLARNIVPNPTMGGHPETLGSGEEPSEKKSSTGGWEREPAMRESAAIEAESGFFVDAGTRTRVFRTKGPGDEPWGVRHQFGPTEIVEDTILGGSTYLYVHSTTCRDPYDGLDYVLYQFDSGGAGGGGFRWTDVWRFDSDSEPLFTYSHYGVALGTPLRADDGTCQWRTLEAERQLRTSALKDMGNGESIPAETIRRAFSRLQSLEIFSFSTWVPTYADQSNSGPWEVALLKSEECFDDTGRVLVHDRRKGTWRTIFEFEATCGLWDDRTVGDMYVTGHTMFAEQFCPSCEGSHHSIGGRGHILEFDLVTGQVRRLAQDEEDPRPEGIPDRSVGVEGEMFAPWRTDE